MWRAFQAAESVSAWSFCRPREPERGPVLIDQRDHLLGQRHIRRRPARARRARGRRAERAASSATRESRPPRQPPQSLRRPGHEPRARVADVRSTSQSTGPSLPTVAPNSYAIWRGKRKVPAEYSALRCRIEIAVSAAARVIRGACPHDCPDTCALLVEVDSAGRATSIKGDAEHPITAGFLCGKVSELPGARVLRGAAAAPARPRGREGRGPVPPGRAGTRRSTSPRAGCSDAIERHGAASVVPYSYLGTQGLVQGDVMANRLFDAIGGSTLVRTICASAGVAGTMATNGASPEVDPEEWVHARTIVVWGWNPLSTAPHLWRLILEARRRGARLIVVDPFRSRTARVADVHLRPLPGHGRARSRSASCARCSTPASPTRSGAGRTRSATTSWSRGSRTRPVESARSAVRRPGRRRARARARARAGPAVADPPRRRRPAARGRADRLPHDRLHPRARGLLAPPRRWALLHPDGHVRRAPRGAPRAAAPARRAPPARSTCRASARR